MKKKFVKISSFAAIAVLATGCVSMDGRMVNAHGATHDCSTQGGGIGLGMVVGAAIAAVSNQSCESDAEEKGFILSDDVGQTGISFDQAESEKAIVVASNPPAHPCIVKGDQIIEIEQKPISSLNEAKEAVFKESGDTINILVSRAGKEVPCGFELN